MDENKELSRVAKYSKRRRIKRNLLIFLGLGFVFVVVLISLITSGNKVPETEKDNPDEEQPIIVVDEEETETEEINNDLITDEDESELEEETNEDSIHIDYVEPSDDNVIEAFIGNWSGIGTTQEGPHTTNYSDGSADRIEIKRAVSYVTGLDENNLVEWRVENGGDQKVIATASDPDEINIYRVFLSWVDVEGWQVTKVEKLKENDKRN